MGVVAVDKSKEYTFDEAKKMLLENSNVIITSKITDDNYIAEKAKDEVVLKYYNSSLDSWRKCDALEPKEIFGMWYVTIN